MKFPLRSRHFSVPVKFGVDPRAHDCHPSYIFNGIPSENDLLRAAASYTDAPPEQFTTDVCVHVRIGSRILFAITIQPDGYFDLDHEASCTRNLLFSSGSFSDYYTMIEYLQSYMERERDAVSLEIGGIR